MTFIVKAGKTNTKRIHRQWRVWEVAMQSFKSVKRVALKPDEQKIEFGYMDKTTDP